LLGPQASGTLRNESTTGQFGEIEVRGKKRYTHDVVIDGGKVRKRKKGPSKQFREKFGHTPLSAGKKFPGEASGHCRTGAHGALR